MIMKTVTLYNIVVMEDLHLYLVRGDGEQQNALSGHYSVRELNLLRQLSNCRLCDPFRHRNVQRLGKNQRRTLKRFQLIRGFSHLLSHVAPSSSLYLGHESQAFHSNPRDSLHRFITDMSAH